MKVTSSSHDHLLTGKATVELGDGNTVTVPIGDLAAYIDARSFQRATLTTENLNAVVEPGTYGQANSSNATAAANYPVTTGGRGVLIVASVNGTTSAVSQTYVSTFYGRVFVRELYSGTWSPWVETTVRDTGWRSLPLGSGASSGRVLIRRVGDAVYAKLEAVTLSGNNRFLCSSIGGFSPHDGSPGADSSTFVFGWVMQGGTYAPWHRVMAYRFGIAQCDETRAGLVLDGQMTWMTDDAWPSSLPGTATA